MEEHAGSLLYRWEYNPYFRTNSKLFPTTEFLVEVLQHRQQSTLRLGEVHKDRPGLSVSAMESRAAWARLLAKIYEVDLLRCPRCASPMRVLAIISDAQKVLRTLRHLIKTGAAPPPRSERTATAPRPSPARRRASRALL